MKKSKPINKKGVKLTQKKPAVYNPAKIETKWQRKWQSSKIFRSKEDSKKPKYYVLDMFPYPSGEGLHVGHPKGYIATDIISRYKRMQGHSVLHPMGFDAFGLPAENYALKTKTNPADSVKKNVARYKKQLEILGFDYDWSREINTTDPAYYKWTQWIFLQLLKKGLAYESYEPINWCPSCKTGLANEDIEGGRCERCGTLVEKKPMRQWVLKITDYAERLLEDLDVRDINKTLVTHSANGEPCFFQVIEPGAIKTELPFVERNAITAIVKHWSEDKYLGLKLKKVPWQTFITGGIEGGQSAEQAAIAEIREETGYQNIRLVKNLGRVHSKFFHIPKGENRFAHFDVLYFELNNDSRVEISEKEKSTHEVVWVSREEMEKFITPEAQKYMWSMYTNETANFTKKSKPLLDWPESIKTLQKNWIGKSEGALIKFKIQNSKFKIESQNIEVFTTRPDTLFGVTYVVLAPEHKLVQELLKFAENRSEVEAYIDSVSNKTEIERTDTGKEKTGVELKGIKAVNPANNEEVHVWLADYVLPDYGTGAVMAVPAHDERDWEFAKKFGLPIKGVIAPLFVSEAGKDAWRKDEPEILRPTVACFIKHWSEEKYLFLKKKADSDAGQNAVVAVAGGIDKGEDETEAGIREIKGETGYLNPVFKKNLGTPIYYRFYSTNAKQNRLAELQPVYYELRNGDKEEVSERETTLHDSIWLTENNLKEFLETRPFSPIFWNRLKGKEEAFVGQGLLINSGSFTGKNSAEIMKEITSFVGGQWVTKYKLRDWVFSRQRYWGEPIPVIHCENCAVNNPAGRGIVPVPEKDLPVVLPKVKSYEPTGTGESPLAAISKWVNVKCPVCKKPAKRETNTMPQWAGSSWYYLRYTDPKNNKALASQKKIDYWLGAGLPRVAHDSERSGVDLYVGGAEHATRHLIYARFWHKFLYDIGVTSTLEPFTKLQHVGLIMGEDGRKMSKRFGNVINPDEITETYGADSLRLYEMFMGPFDQQIAWSTQSIVVSRRFIEKVWKLKEKVTGVDVYQSQTDVKKSDRIIHQSIQKVTSDIDKLSFNTAISALMIAVNELEKMPVISRKNYEILLKLLAPFTPHFTEELWFDLGNKKSIHISEWPKFEKTRIVEDEITIMVQVNGKIRGSFQASVNSKNQELENKAVAVTEVKKWLEGKKVMKVIVVPKRLVNVVIV